MSEVSVPYGWPIKSIGFLSGSVSKFLLTPMSFQVTIDNQSGAPDAIFLTIQGIDDTAGDGVQKFFDPLESKWHTEPVAVLLTSLPSSGGQSHLFELPRIKSGVLFLSIGNPLHFDGATPPVPGSVNDPDYNTLWDKFEVSFLVADAAPFVNTTNVDFFCFPVSVHADLPAGAGEVKGIARSRSDVLNAFSGLPPRWAQLLATDIQGDDTIVRVLAPGKATDSPNRFDAGFFQAYVDRVWDFYRAPADGSTPVNVLQVDLTELAAEDQKLDGVILTGIVNGDLFTFTGKKTDGTAISASFTRPQGDDPSKGLNPTVFGCDGVFSAPNKTVESIPAKNLAAALNTGVAAIQPGAMLLARDAPDATPKGWGLLAPRFYTQTLPTDGGTIECFNAYAKVLHSVAEGASASAPEGGLVYAFAYDDVTAHDSTVSDPQASGVTVTIGDCRGKVLLPQSVDETLYDCTFTAGSGVTGSFVAADGTTVPFVPQQPVKSSGLRSPLKFRYDDTGSGERAYYMRFREKDSSLSGVNISVDPTGPNAAVVTVALPGKSSAPVTRVAARVLPEERAAVVARVAGGAPTWPPRE